MVKKLIALLMAVSMAFTTSAVASAKEKPKANLSNASSGIRPLWSNTNIVTATLNFHGEKAVCTSFIQGKNGTTKITATALLKRVNSNGTTTVKAWTGLKSSGNTLYFDKSYYVDKGYTYEFEIDANVYRNGKAEYVSESDSDYCGG